MRSLAFFAVTILVWLLGGAGSLSAQWSIGLRAEQSSAVVNEAVSWHGFAPQRARGERRLLWPEQDCRWAFLREGGGQSNWDQLRATEAEGSEVLLTHARAGIALFGVEWLPRVVETDDMEWREWARRHELWPSPLSTSGTGSGARARNGSISKLSTTRVRVSRCAKSLLRVYGPQSQLGPSDDSQGKTGQRAEIRPLADPTALTLGADLPLRVYLPEGEGEEIRRHVLARHLKSGQRIPIKLRPESIGFVTLSQLGTWCIEAYALQRLADDAEADWELTSATLTFELGS